MDDFKFLKGDALLIVDVQNDFCAGGALAVKDADTIIPEINRWIDASSRYAVPVLASRDWHPQHHLSFDSEGGPWPAHCINDSYGAQFHSDLALPSNTIVVTKGVRFDQDQYSAFDQTGLDVYLENNGIKRIILTGLALDVCVQATALDARQHDIDVVLIAAATRSVFVEDGLKALDKMRAAGVTIG